MSDKSIGSARLEETENTTTRVHVERASGESVALFLEPGSSIVVEEDGPLRVEAFALD